ncbi:MAG TPA: hypothetical protein ENI58_04725 [Nitrospirae bacterium]|nr:hypothetical protein [Nitrospirota bacterium]
MNESETYRVEIEDPRVTLKTTSFKAERGSVLHSGIFNREFSSSFVAVAVAAAVLAFFALRHELHLLHYVVAVAVFIVVLPLARIYLFKEPCLETVFDLDAESVSITLRKPFGGKSIKRPLDSLDDIRISHIRIEPENPDAVTFVKKISLQHGTVIPGFGEGKDFYSVELRFDGEGFVILTTGTESEAKAVVDQLRRYIDV